MLFRSEKQNRLVFPSNGVNINKNNNNNNIFDDKFNYYIFGGKNDEKFDDEKFDDEKFDKSEIDLIKQNIDKNTSFSFQDSFQNNVLNSKLFQQLQIISLGIALKILSYSASFFQIDFNNVKENEEKLKKLRQYLKNPEIKKEIKKIIEESADVALLTLKASQPFIDEFSNVIVDETSKLLEKLLNSSSIIIGNFIKEMPGIGLMFVLIQDIEKVIEAGLASINAGAKISKEFANFVSATKDNYDNILNKKIGRAHV